MVIPKLVQLEKLEYGPVSVYPSEEDFKRKKEEIWLSPMTKAPTPTEKSKKATWQHKNVTKNFDYTTIADRLKSIEVTTATQQLEVITATQLVWFNRYTGTQPGFKSTVHRANVDRIQLKFIHNNC